MLPLLSFLETNTGEILLTFFHEFFASEISWGFFVMTSLNRRVHDGSHPWVDCERNEKPNESNTFRDVPHPLSNPVQGWKISFLMSTNNQLVPWSAGLDSITLVIISVHVTPD